MLSSAKQVDIGTGLLNKILEATKEGVIVVDRGLNIVAGNRSAEQAFRVLDAALVGRSLNDLVEDDKILTAFVKGFAKLEISDLHLKLGPKGNRRRYDVHVAPLDLDGVPHAIGFFYDVTQVHRLENIRQAFLSNISHELRTPLTSILAFVETLENGGLEDTENNRHFLNVIQRNGERMRDLIADILELSQIEAGSVSIEVKAVPLWRHVDEIMTNLSSMAAERQIVLKNDTSQASVVRADPKRLGQMLTNLIDNAIRFNRRGGSVMITDEVSEGRHLIRVTDTGEGMEHKELQRVFERFYRVDRSRTREVGGTGLGLAIVKHLARLHGGEVSVQSELGVGTTFTIDIPIAPR